MTSSVMDVRNELVRAPDRKLAVAPSTPRLRPLIVPIILLALWEIAAHTGLADPRFLPTLEAIVVNKIAPGFLDRHLARTGTLRFTPPMQVLAAFAQACREHEADGGSPARLARFEANWRRLVDGMRQMGFRTVVPDEPASPIVATFHNPDDPAFSFDALFQGMKRRGFVIFPGRLALANTFRIGCMGDVSAADMGRAMEAVAETMAEMGVHAMGRGASVSA